MRYRSYGLNGPHVSVLGFGVMRLPPRKRGVWGSVNFTKAIPVMRAAMERGVNFFDTHHEYHDGLSEVAIGRALKGWAGQRIVIQTKTPFYQDKPLDHFKKLLDQALEKTGVDCIDYLLFHSMRADVFRKRRRAFFTFTDWAIKRRLIRYRGFSSHDTPENVKAFVDTGEFAAMVVSYNLLNPAMAGTIAHAARQGMGVAIMNPVAGGTLAENTPHIRRLLPAAKSSPEIALRYVLATPGVALAMSGMNTFEHIEENVAIASRKTYLTPKQRQTLRGRLKTIQRQATRLCTACGYCMPCPSGVNIPQNFTLLARARLYGLVDVATHGFRALRRRKTGDASALACVKCGKCLPKCPHEIPIIDQLIETAELLDQ